MKVDKSLLVPVLGWLQILLLGGMVSLMFLMIGTSSAPEWKQGLGFAVLSVFAAVFMTLIARIHIMPWEILKDCGALAEKTAQKCHTAKA